MKNLDNYIYEELSNDNINELKKYINDVNFNDFIKLIQRNAKVFSLNDHNDAYEKFFDTHGLSTLNWGRNNSAKEAFIKLFADNDKVDVLTQIVNNNGVLSINNLAENGNIFDLCKINGHDFSNEAKIIATWINSKSASAGPCEMLLKFILKEGYTGTIGDVSIHPKQEMEVKASTIGKFASGGHAAGQKGYNGVKIRGAWSIYLYLNKHLFNLSDSNANADKSEYFQNKTGFAKFVKLLKDNNINEKNSDAFVKTLVDAICFQYNFITNEDNAKNSLNNINDLYNAAINFYNSNKCNLNDFKSILNLVGCIQLYLYSQIEKFDYFFCVLIDKAGNSSQSGNYWFVKNCNVTLLNFDVITDNINFGVLDSPTSSQGRTGKMYFIC